MARGPNLRSEPARWTRDTDNWASAAPPNYFNCVKTSVSWSSLSDPLDAFRYPKTSDIYPLTALFRREGRTFEKTELGKKTLLTKWRCSSLLPWQLSIKKKKGTRMYQWRIRSNLPALQDTHNSGGVPVCLFPPRLACCYQPEEIQYLAVSLDGYFHRLKIQLVQQYNHKEILAQPTNGHNNNKRLITCKRFISLISIFVKKNSHY